MYRRVIFAAGLVLALASRAHGQDDTTSPIRLDLDGSILYGPVQGFVQIPSGGMVGTTTPYKPTLSQMGIRDVVAEDVQLEGGYDGPGLYAGIHFVHLNGSNPLGVPLASGGVDFPAGTTVRGYLKLDWYRFGAQWGFPGRPTQEYPFSIRPGVGFLLLSQAYQLLGNGGQNANRSFSIGAPQIIVDAEWLAIGPLSLFGRFTTTLPFPKLPWILTAEARVRLQIFGTDLGASDDTAFGSGAQGGFVFVGIAFDRVESNDEQRAVANHVRAIMGPLFVGGLELRF